MQCDDSTDLLVNTERNPLEIQAVVSVHLSVPKIPVIINAMFPFQSMMAMMFT